MLKIFTPDEAENSILRRSLGAGTQVSEGVLSGIARIFGEPLTPETAVARLLADVRERGDLAIVEWTDRIDGIYLESFRIPEEAIDAAFKRIPGELQEALAFAARRIRDFHERQPIPNWTTTEMGGVLGQRFTPVGSAGVYVPGGTAPLPSSLLMSAIPAQVAGVPRIIITTPPGRPDGRISDVILAAAAVAGCKEVYAAGGALAVAAMAFGTKSVPRVDKIVGPGNLFTTLAKQQVYGIVGIDGIYGPTETAVVADDTADPAWVAADLLAQAEHDVLASAILFTHSRELAEAVQVEAARQMEDLSRADVIAQALTFRGGIVLVDDLQQACELASAYAAEHTCLAVHADLQQTCKDVIANAGGLFIGERSFEVLGDYVAGPSHTMPTGGTARFASPLNVLDFMKITSIIELDDKTSAQLSPIAARIAAAEQLTAHQNAAMMRME
ncbi:MAG: histidinol dehydrogenase [Candidatus Promineifilaceae bacterium]